MLLTNSRFATTAKNARSWITGEQPDRDVGATHIVFPRDRLAGVRTYVYALAARVSL